MMASSLSPAKEAKGESTREPNWLELPRDVTINILHKLGTFEIVTSARNVCPLWWNICKDPLMWRTIDMGSNDFILPHHSDYLKICCYAIDQSGGHLEDINILNFGTDDLLKYIGDTDRASRLRRIRLSRCFGISDKGLTEVAKKLPLLEELDISCDFLTKDSLEAIGRCCPLLKAVKLSKYGILPYECDDEAFVIAKNMPELRRLHLFGNRLTNDGLLAILDGCPHLESLNLQYCSNVDLRGSLGRRCDEQIKDLRLQNDEDSHLKSVCEASWGNFYFASLDNYDYDFEYDFEYEDINW